MTPGGISLPEEKKRKKEEIGSSSALLTPMIETSTKFRGGS